MCCIVNCLLHPFLTILLFYFLSLSLFTTSVV
jgi:hypothetical protein